MKNKSYTPLEKINSARRNSLTGFTLMELLVVIIIIGVLATLGLTHYGAYKEKTLDREAQANLKLIKAAEKIYRMENTFYYPSTGSTAVVSDINNYLKLQLTTTNWNYKINNATATTFTGKTQRVSDDNRVWCIDQANDVPYGCSW